MTPEEHFRRAEELLADVQRFGTDRVDVLYDEDGIYLGEWTGPDRIAVAGVHALLATIGTPQSWQHVPGSSGRPARIGRPQ